MDEVMKELETELGIDIAYDPKDEVAVIQSTVGTMMTYFGVPLSEEIRAEEPETEPIRHEAIRMDCPRMGGDRSDSRSVKKRTRIQKRRKKKMNEPSMKDTILLVITVLALVLALSGAEMLTNLDPHPLAGCICLALGGTWITLICFANSEAGKEFLEDVRCQRQ